MPVCSHCGKEVSEGIKFCPECGERLKKEFTPEETEKYIRELDASVEEEKPAKKTKTTKKQLTVGIVGCIIGVIAIIAAVAICTPIEPLSITASEQNYAATMEDHALRVAEALDELSALMANPQIGYDEWTIDVAIQITIIRLLYDEAQEIEPPNSMAAIHYNYMQAMWHYDRSMDLIVEGTDTLNANLISQATSELELGGDYIEEAIRLLSDFIAARSP